VRAALIVFGCLQLQVLHENWKEYIEKKNLVVLVLGTPSKSATIHSKVGLPLVASLDSNYSQLP
jgi:hypothetical protein